MNIVNLASEVLQESTKKQFEYEEQKRRLRRQVRIGQLDEDQEAEELAKLVDPAKNGQSEQVKENNAKRNSDRRDDSNPERVFQVDEHPVVDSSVDTILNKDDVEFDYTTGTYKKKEKHAIRTSVKQRINENQKLVEKQLDDKIQSLKEKAKADNQELTENELQKVRNDQNGRTDDAVDDVQAIKETNQKTQQSLDYMRVLRSNSKQQSVSLDSVAMQMIVQNFVNSNDLEIEASTQDPSVDYLTTGVATLDPKDVGQISLDRELSTGARNILSAHASDPVDPVKEKTVETDTKVTDTEKETEIEPEADKPDQPEMTALDWQITNAQLQPSNETDPTKIQLTLGFGSPDISRIENQQKKLKHDHIHNKQLDKQLAHDLAIAKKQASKNQDLRVDQVANAERVKDTPVRHVSLKEFNEIMKDNKMPELKVETVQRLNEAKTYNLDKFLESNPLYTKAVLYDSRAFDMTAGQLGFTHSDLADLDTIRPSFNPTVERDNVADDKVIEMDDKTPQDDDLSLNADLDEDRGGPEY